MITKVDPDAILAGKFQPVAQVSEGGCHPKMRVEFDTEKYKVKLDFTDGWKAKIIRAFKKYAVGFNPNQETFDLLAPIYLTREEDLIRLIKGFPRGNNGRLALGRYYIKTILGEPVEDDEIEMASVPNEELVAL